MKNFKKVLALVLAIATLLSFATVASAKTADFADAKDVKNVEAVDVLSYIKVLEGYPADKSFKPAKNITREEAAKIIAIFANKSTDISSLYTSANPFADMKGRWGESYVAYGYRAGIIAGKNATSFVPKANVKGTEFLKMVLVVLGYDQNKEGLVGSSWAVNTLELAKYKKLLSGLGKDFDPNAALTRDQAAQIMLNALKAEKVVYGQTITNLVWNAKTGYWMTTNTAANAVYVSPNGAVNNYNHELLAKDFNLTLVDTQDKWGRPTHTWSKGADVIGEYKSLDTLLATYQTAVTECDIAKDAGFTDDKTLDLYVNGLNNKSIDKVRVLATAATMGAQGRLTEVYTDRIVMVDTFLAKVDNVTEVKYDAAGHIKDTAKLTLRIYDTATTTKDAAVNTAATQVVLESKSNYAYAKGDFVLVNAYTESGNRSESGRVSTAADKKYVEVVGKAESFEGAQTVVWYNAGKHTVEGTTYTDSNKFFLDEAKSTYAQYASAVKHTWFKDLYGNVIGNVSIATVYNYGVITNMWYDNEGLTGKAMAEVRYMDNTTNTVTMASIKLNGDTVYKPVYSYASASNTMKTVGTTLYVASNAPANKLADSKNADIICGHLFAMNTLADGTIAFEKVTNQLVDNSDGSKNVSVVNKRAVITADNSPAKSTAASVSIDANTKFMYATPVNAQGAYDRAGTYEFKYATGMNEVPSFSYVDRLDYVDANGDGIADYIYIMGKTTDAVKYDYVMVIGKAYAAQLKDTGSYAYYEVTLPIKGENDSTVTLKVAVDKYTNVITNGLCKDDNLGKLFYVQYTNDFVTSVAEVTNVYKNFDTKNPDTRAVLLTDAVQDGEKVIVGTVTLEGTPSTTAKKRFNITDTTEVYGTLSADMTDKNVYVLISSKDTDVITKVYVCDKLGSTTNPTLTYKTTLTYVARLYTGINTYEDVVIGSQEVTLSALTQNVNVTWANLTSLVNASAADQKAASFTPAANAVINMSYINASGYTQITGSASQTVPAVSGVAQTVVFTFTK